MIKGKKYLKIFGSFYVTSNLKVCSLLYQNVLLPSLFHLLQIERMLRNARYYY